MPATLMAKSVMASAERETALRQGARTRCSMAETSVPDIAIPTQKM